MPDLFKSGRGKIARAKKHFAEFDTEADQFFRQENLYESFVDHDPDRPGKDIWKLRLKHPFPEGLDEIVGDAINNLRSALDHACHAAARASGQITPLHTYFPFGKTQGDFDNQAAGNCKDVPLEIREMIRRYGPYLEGNDVLWSLNRISVRDKHTWLIRAGVRVANSFSGHGGGAVRFPMDPSWDHDKNEVEFAELTSGAEGKFHFEFTFFIAFGEVEIVSGEPVSAVLAYFIDIVEQIVSGIEAESRRLGHTI